MSTVKFIGKQLARRGEDMSFLPLGNHGGVWQAWQMPSGNVMVQALDENKHPEGPLVPISQELFDEKFMPVSGTTGLASASDPDLLKKWYIESLIASGKKPDFSILKSSTAREEEGIFLEKLGIATESFLKSDPVAPKAKSKTAQLEEERAQEDEKRDLVLEVYENRIKDKFRSFIERINVLSIEEACSILKKFLDSPEFDKPDLHYLFTDFGLDLRREKAYSLALICHEKALEHNPEDERILFNIARTEYELGNVDQACKYLEKSLSIDPDFSVAENFLNFLKGNIS